MNGHGTSTEPTTPYKVRMRRRDRLGRYIPRPPRPSIGAVNREPSGMNDGHVGQRHDMKNGCFDALRPVFWKREACKVGIHNDKALRQPVRSGRDRRTS